MENPDDGEFAIGNEIVDFHVIETVDRPRSQSGEPAIFHGPRRACMRSVGNALDRSFRRGKETVGYEVLPDLNKVVDLPEDIGAGRRKDNRFHCAPLLR